MIHLQIALQILQMVTMTTKMMDQLARLVLMVMTSVAGIVYFARGRETGGTCDFVEAFAALPRLGAARGEGRDREADRRRSAADARPRPR